MGMRKRQSYCRQVFVPKDGQCRVCENRSELPRAYAAHHAIAVGNAHEELRTIRHASFNPRSSIFIEANASVDEAREENFAWHG